jgi:hypothetical protein
MLDLTNINFFAKVILNMKENFKVEEIKIYESEMDINGDSWLDIYFEFNNDN